MAKIDETVMRETRYVIKVIIILSVIMEAVFLIVGIWNYKVLIGNIFGGTIAAVNFLLMGITVQKAVLKNEKDAATTMKLSQTLRNGMLLVGTVLAITLPFMNGAAAVIPLFFPRIAMALIPFRDRNSTEGKVNSNGE